MKNSQCVFDFSPNYTRFHPRSTEKTTHGKPAAGEQANPISLLHCIRHINSEIRFPIKKPRLFCTSMIEGKRKTILSEMRHPARDKSPKDNLALSNAEKKS